MRMPVFAGEPIRIERQRNFHDRRGPVHAGSFLRERRIVVDCTRKEFPRILVHELAHFIWVRLSNSKRSDYEVLIRAELTAKARGELGWSAEWRKDALTSDDICARSRRWREYCCESFCDTAAWLYSGVKKHEEFTLARRFRRGRAEWFQRSLGAGPLSI